MHILSKLAVATIIVSSGCELAAAQNRTVPPVTSTQQGSSHTKRSGHADETFELNIDERKITSTNFEASTAVGTDANPQRLDLQIGVALGATRIDGLLLNVRGRVRFRGSLNRILILLNSRRPDVQP